MRPGFNFSYFWLAGGVALVLFGGSTGGTRQIDGQVYLEQAQALWLHGSLVLDIGKSQESAFWVADRYGNPRGRFVPGLAVLLGPGIYAGALASGLTGCKKALPFLAAAWLCVLVGTGCALLSAALISMGISPAPAFTAALLVVLGDTASWYVTQTIWSESAVLFALALVWWQTARWLSSQVRADALKLGLLLGCLPWLHPVLWPVALFLSLLWFFKSRREAQPGLWLISGVLPPLLLLLVYNSVLFGAPLRGGYSQETGQWTPGGLLETLPLIMLDFLRSHWPALLGALGAFWLLPRKSRWLAAAALGAAAIHLLLLSCRKPEMLTRLLAPQALLLAPGLAALLEHLNLKRRGIFLYCLIPIAAAGALFDYGFLTPPLVINDQPRLLPHCWWVLSAVKGNLWALLAGPAVFLSGIWAVRRAFICLRTESLFR